MSFLSIIIAYLKDNPRGYWFKRKLYGWGWVPARWQGWAMLLVYVVLLFGIVVRVDAVSQSESGVWLKVLIPVAVLTTVVIAICFWKGEKPKWQWGIPKDYE